MPIFFTSLSLNFFNFKMPKLTLAATRRKKYFAEKAAAEAKAVQDAALDQELKNAQDARFAAGLEFSQEDGLTQTLFVEPEEEVLTQPNEATPPKLERTTSLQPGAPSKLFKKTPHPTSKLLKKRAKAPVVVEVLDSDDDELEEGEVRSPKRVRFSDFVEDYEPEFAEAAKTAAEEGSRFPLGDAYSSHPHMVACSIDLDTHEVDGVNMDDTVFAAKLATSDWKMCYPSELVRGQFFKYTRPTYNDKTKRQLVCGVLKDYANGGFIVQAYKNSMVWKLVLNNPKYSPYYRLYRSISVKPSSSISLS